ncbi:MAG TPA: ATP-binding protein, partial [Actinomycetota bacterium]|nr:ATP-binding protein [Actinomycetota bacterium]
MDELPLFRRDVLEALRGPLEDGVVQVVRSGGSVTFPCRFSLVAAMNPCPCGYGEEGALCPCSPSAVRAYRARISGPLMDRFDLHLTMTRLRAADLMREREGEPSATIRERVEHARSIQRERYRAAGATNAAVSKRTLLLAGRFRPEAYEQLHGAIDEYRLTGRGTDRVLRVARTVADLRGSEHVGPGDVVSALGFRYVEEREADAA